MDTDVPVLANQHKHIYISFVWTLDVVWKTYWKQWMIGTDGEREPEKSILSKWFDVMMASDNFQCIIIMW